MKSVMQHNFSEVPNVEIPRSSFDRSHGLKTAFDASGLYPILVDEVLPGDTFNVRMTGFVRMSTPLNPIMDNVMIETFFFFVPCRLVWDNWQKFMGERVDPDDSIDYVVPVMEAPPAGGYPEETLFDYMGIPTKVENIQPISLPFRAYNLIWNEWFRDQNLQDSTTVNTGDADDPVIGYGILKRGKRHDYFTSCLPWPQKQDQGVELPLGTSAPVTTDGTPGTSTDYLSVISSTDDTLYRIEHVGGNFNFVSANAGVANGQMYADLSSATAATINQIRQAFQIQKLLERDARGGTRYIEIVRSHFGVTSPDARLQRPEYLGGGFSNVNVQPVPNTTNLSANVKPGQLGAYATAVLDGHGFTKSFTEHGYIIGLVNARADLTYQQGLNRMFSRSTRYDYYWPSLSHIGEQAVLNKEIYAQGTADDDLTFGFQERSAEYRYKPSQVTGVFRSNHSAPLDSWHLALDFASLPALNDSFMRENVPMSRIQVVTTEPDFIADLYFSMRCVRPMPLYGVPGLVDHF